jgi:hypothetical protein
MASASVTVWDLHVLPHLGDRELRQITPEVVANLRTDLDAADIGPAAIRQKCGLQFGTRRQILSRTGQPSRL